MHGESVVIGLSSATGVLCLVNVWLLAEQGHTQGGILVPSHRTNQYRPSVYPVGSLRSALPGTALGRNWKLADGSLYKRVEYPQLFDVVGRWYCGDDARCDDADDFRVPNTTARALSHGRDAAYGGATVASVSLGRHTHQARVVPTQQGSFRGNQCGMPAHSHSWGTETGTPSSPHDHEVSCNASSVEESLEDASHNHGAPDVRIGTHSSSHRHRHSCPKISPPYTVWMKPDQAEPKPYCDPSTGDNCNTCKDSPCLHRPAARYCSWRQQDHRHVVDGKLQHVTPSFTKVLPDERLQIPDDPLTMMNSTPSRNTRYTDHPMGEDVSRPVDGSHVHTFKKWTNHESGGHAHTISVDPSAMGTEAVGAQHAHVLRDTQLRDVPYESTHTHADVVVDTDSSGGAGSVELSRSEYDLLYYIKMY